MIARFLLWLLSFQKLTDAPTHAVLTMKPGSTLDLVLDDKIVAKVILSEVNRDFTRGTTVRFEDYYRWIGRNHE